MSTDTPRPERVTLTDEERQQFENRLRWHFNVVAEEGKGSVYIGLGVENAVLDIESMLAARLAAREQALREEIAGQIEAKIQPREDHDSEYVNGHREGRFLGLHLAARIARGETRWTTEVDLCGVHARVVVQKLRWSLEAEIRLSIHEREQEAKRRMLEAQGNGEGSLVYYVRIGDYIKIGYSARLKNRFRSLRADELLAIEPGALEVERERHAQFKADRIDLRRENFRPSPELMAHIDALHERYGLPHWATLPKTSVVTTRRKESA